MRAEEVGDEEMLDVDTSAAMIRWMDTAVVPEGIDPEQWRHWADDGCRGTLEARRVPVTAAMLGHWARTGALR